MQKAFIWIVLAVLAVGCFHDTAAQNVTRVEPPGTTGPSVNITGSRNFTVDSPAVPTDQKPIIGGYTQLPDSSIAVYFINVGTPAKQGDAILIKKGDLDILVDAGPAESGSTVRNFLRTRNVDDIEVWVSTHADEEHYGGMREVMKEFGVESVWWTGQAFSDTAYYDLIVELQNSGAQVHTVKRGQMFDMNGIRIQALNPRVSQPYNNADNDALVLRLVDRQFCILLTSDIQAGPQGDLANMRSEDIQCAIMQAPYHGLGRGNAKLDLAMLAIKPEVVIVSGGPNEAEGGARQPLFERLKLRGIGYYENYKNGTVRVVSDGAGYNITYVQPPSSP